MTNLDNNYDADLLDAMADRDQDLREAMQETCQSEWSLTEIDGQLRWFL